MAVAIVVADFNALFLTRYIYRNRSVAQIFVSKKALLTGVALGAGSSWASYEAVRYLTAGEMAKFKKEVLTARERLEAALDGLSDLESK